MAASAARIDATSACLAAGSSAMRRSAGANSWAVPRTDDGRISETTLSVSGVTLIGTTRPAAGVVSPTDA